MEIASRIVSILLGTAVMIFVLWPVTIPVGFSEVWWASRQGHARLEPEPIARPESQSEAKPAVPAPSPHAVAPSTPPPAEPAAGNKDAAKLAALKESDKTGTVSLETPAPKAATKLYHRVTVRDGGTLQSGKIVIRLAGIAARDEDATCKDANGKPWRCGGAAKAALARLIRGRAVACVLPKGGEHNIFDARCSVGGIDLSEWMVRQGWAEAKDPALVEAVKQAKADRLGLWRAGE
jgi:endonuclease YncB( thermonuclease family)